MRAGDGEEGLALAARHLPGIITLDIHLPSMDGWEFMRRLKADPAITDTTRGRHHRSDDRDHCIALGRGGGTAETVHSAMSWRRPWPASPTSHSGAPRAPACWWPTTTLKAVRVSWRRLSMGRGLPVCCAPTVAPRQSVRRARGADVVDPRPDDAGG
jgi:hypothetical protein